MDSPLSHFRFAQFQFVLKAVDPLYLPAYKGSTFRGGFGHAFKKVICVGREKDCSFCLLKGKCVYSYVFETPPPPDTSKMRKYPFAPHPFVITPPLEEKTVYQPGETLSFGLTLVGKSIDYLPYFIYTFEELGRMGIGGRRGKFELEELIAIPADERCKVMDVRGETIYSGREKVLRSSDFVVHFKDFESFPLSPLTLHLTFLTPTRLKFDGKLSPSLEFHILIRNLLRRLSLLSHFHCGEELDLDFKGLIEESQLVKLEESYLSWFEWQRYSQRQETRHDPGWFHGFGHF